MLVQVLGSLEQAELVLLSEVPAAEFIAVLEQAQAAEMMTDTARDVLEQAQAAEMMMDAERVALQQISTAETMLDEARDGKRTLNSNVNKGRRKQTRILSTRAYMQLLVCYLDLRHNTAVDS